MAAILKATFLLVVLLLLSDFIFAEKFIYIVMSPSAKGTKSSAEKLSGCSDDEVLITEKEPEPKCYPKVHQVYQECKRNEQCMTKNAFCGYHESNDFQAMLCMCNLVYYASSWDNRTCVQVNRCVRPEEDNVNDGDDDQTSNESNINATRLDCPSALQVCQDEGICLCVENYTFNQYGECVTPSEARESSNLSTENEPNNLVLYLVVGIGAATAVLIAIAFTIYYVKKKKSHNSNGDSKDDSTDREMELFKVSEQ